MRHFIVIARCNKLPEPQFIDAINGTMDKFEAMRALVSIADTGSFVGAANELEQSKSALSRRVTELERALGVRLIQRTTRSLALTDEGHTYLARCREILQTVAEAEEEASMNSSEVRGLLRISAPLSFGTLRLAPLFAEFARRHPQVRLDVVLSDQMVDLLEDGFDLAIRITAEPPLTRAVALPLCRSRILMCASPDYLARHGAPADVAGLSAHTLIDYSLARARGEWTLSRGDERERVRVTSPLVANNGELCRAFALAGLGITRQPDFIVGDDIAAGRLQEVLPGWRCGEVSVFALYPTRHHQPARLRALIALLREALGGAPALPSA